MVRSLIPFAGPPLCLTPEEIAAVDSAAIRAGLSGAALMESAGGSVAQAIRDRWPDPGRAVILVGGGNNGGDGLVVARRLTLAGWQVELVFLADPGNLRGDAAGQWALVEPLGLPMQRVHDPVGGTTAIDDAAATTCVVDAVLGTGLSGDVREPARSTLGSLAASGLPVVAVDAPSGLDGASGRVRGVAAPAVLTVTFGFPKPGHFLAEGPGLCGRLIVAPLGYPPAAIEAAGRSPLGWTTLATAAAALPPLAHDLHKGAAGRLLVVAGSAEFRGAALLTATAALRTGTGLCVVATPEPAATFLLEHRPEAIVVALPTTKSGALGAKAADAVQRAAADADAVAVGPGLTTGRGVRAVVEAALAAGRPAVVDADALNVLADDPASLVRDAATALTPHPGELGRWLDRPAAEIDADRCRIAPDAARRFGAHVVLKGSPTVVADPEGRTALNLTGNPGLATGGSGDVLTGLLGSLLAQGVEAGLACRAAPLLHGLAADWAAGDLGERGLVPSDLFRYLPLVVREVSAGHGRALLERLDHPYGDLLAAEGAIT